MCKEVLVPVDVEDANELGLLGAADGEAVVDALDDPREELRVDALGERVASIARLCIRVCCGSPAQVHTRNLPIAKQNAIRESSISSIRVYKSACACASKSRESGGHAHAFTCLANGHARTSCTVSGLTNVSLAVTTLRWQSHLRAPATSTSSRRHHQSKCTSCACRTRVPVYIYIRVHNSSSSCT